MQDRIAWESRTSFPIHCLYCRILEVLSVSSVWALPRPSFLFLLLSTLLFSFPLVPAAAAAAVVAAAVVVTVAVAVTVTVIVAAIATAVAFAVATAAASAAALAFAAVAAATFVAAVALATVVAVQTAPAVAPVIVFELEVVAEIVIVAVRYLRGGLLRDYCVASHLHVFFSGSPPASFL